VKRAAREDLGVAVLSSYAVAEEIERGELDVFRLRGHPRLTRDFRSLGSPAAHFHPPRSPSSPHSPALREASDLRAGVRGC